MGPHLVKKTEPPPRPPGLCKDQVPGSSQTLAEVLGVGGSGPPGLCDSEPEGQEAPSGFMGWEETED